MTLPSGVTIRPAAPADAEALTGLHLDCWDDAYAGLLDPAILVARRSGVAERAERWRRVLAGPGTTLAAEHEGGLVGFVCPGAARDPEPGPAEEVYALYVRARWWGTGIGHALLVAALGDRPAYLWVLEGNDRAIRFYERQGFRRDGGTRAGAEGTHLRMVRG